MKELKNWDTFKPTVMVLVQTSRSNSCSGFRVVRGFVAFVGNPSASLVLLRDEFPNRGIKPLLHSSQAEEAAPDADGTDLRLYAATLIGIGGATSVRT